MGNTKKIIYIDGGLASQMSAYSFFLYLKSKDINPEMDFVWFKRFGREKYELKKVFDINVPEYKGSLKYDLYISKNILARMFRKTKFLKVLINLGVIPKLYYTMRTPFGGKIFNIDDLPRETFNLNLEQYFWGYWPFGEYIYKIEEILMHNFSFPPIYGKENILLAEDIEKHNSVSIHIRRGDYLKFRNTFAEVTLDYYNNAIRYIEQHVENPKYYIFSDDAEWCKTELKKIRLLEDNATYISWNSGDKSYRDMQLMSLCKNNIIANSGFSSWAAILNQNKDKIVIEPKCYFTKEWIEANDPEFCKYQNNNWIQIDN